MDIFNSVGFIGIIHFRSIRIYIILNVEKKCIYKNEYLGEKFKKCRFFFADLFFKSILQFNNFINFDDYIGKITSKAIRLHAVFN